MCNREIPLLLQIKLMNFFTLLKSEELRIYKYLQKRSDDCIMLAHILSFMLHRKYRRERLTNDQEGIARKWVNTID